MAEHYPPSLQRPVNVRLHDQRDCLQEPLTTFTALLHAAHSAGRDALAIAEKKDATERPDGSGNERRLRNRISCRKTRLKRKLQQHALELLARDRHARHAYLTQLTLALSSEDTPHEELFREFVAKNLHYALIDSNYCGWLKHDQDQRFSRYGMRSSSSRAGDGSQSRRLKRPRRESEHDAFSALATDLQSPQASFDEQWIPIVDGLQNIDLQLDRMDEKEVAPRVFERHCHWKFVGVSLANMNRVGAIAASAVSGITRLRFYGRHVQSVSIHRVRRENNVAFDFTISDAPRPSACQIDQCVCRQLYVS
ncbi:hypothetical protein PsorP6_012064 [Peronosclerospora sorghi]|uniref:Uncharacterized protein n=1 Tax=Peronosclerospora sorghi TaxID=230839 RepID=A0ACC0WJ63_9STRA|nr:hypothetical protein PsorP6_012064 [Peronosclerospora sorghi]